MTELEALQTVETMRQAFTGGSGKDHDLLRVAVETLVSALRERNDAAAAAAEADAGSEEEEDIKAA